MRGPREDVSRLLLCVSVCVRARACVRVASLVVLQPVEEYLSTVVTDSNQTVIGAEGRARHRVEWRPGCRPIWKHCAARRVHDSEVRACQSSVDFLLCLLSFVGLFYRALSACTPERFSVPPPPLSLSLSDKLAHSLTHIHTHTQTHIPERLLLSLARHQQHLSVTIEVEEGHARR